MVEASEAATLGHPALESDSPSPSTSSTLIVPALLLLQATPVTKDVFSDTELAVRPGWAAPTLAAAAEPTDTLAMRRLRSYWRLPPHTGGPEEGRQVTLADGSTTPQVGVDGSEAIAPSNASAAWDFNRGKRSDPWPETDTSGIESTPLLDYRLHPTIHPAIESAILLFPQASGSSPGSSPRSALPLASPLATLVSSVATSPISPSADDNLRSSLALSPRRSSDPLPSLATPGSPRTELRSLSGQGTKAWFPLGSTPSPAQLSTATSTTQALPGLEFARTISAASSSISSKTATGLTSSAVTTHSSHHRFAAAAELDQYAPSLPSPLSTCHTPETLAADLHPWIPSSASLLPSGSSARGGGAGEFPFPPSPSAGSWSSCSSHLSQPPSPPEESLSKSLHHASSASRTERGRSQSGGATSPATPIAGAGVRHPPASTHWHAASSSATSTSFSRHSQSTSRSSSGSLLTPPESSTSSKLLPTSADLAWNDLGLGGLRGGSPFGLPYNTTQFDIAGLAASSGVLLGAKSSVADLMSLESEVPASTTSATPKRQPKSNLAGTDDKRNSTAESAKRVGHEDLMGGTGGGHFGPATREKLARVISDHIGAIPLPEGEGIINIVEYGALNSRSASIVAPIISHLATRQANYRMEQGLPISDDDRVSFQVIHTDKVASDFRPLVQQLETHSDSYLNPIWGASHRPTLDNKVFSSFAGRSFGAKVLPKGSVSVGFSAMALHWLSTDRKYRSSPATIAHGELMAFLSARATEFKPGGLFAMAFISRSKDHVAMGPASPSSARTVHPGLIKTHSDGGRETVALAGRPLIRERSASSPAAPVGTRDIWTVLTGILGKALQRLVSTQLLKPAVARQLLVLPIYPRSVKQTRAVLESMNHAWSIETEECAVLSHPAWRGFEHGTVSAASYADHTIQLLKIFFESEMRAVLREALISRAACEWLLESVFDIAKEKVEEEGPQPLELEVQIVALRRRTDADATN